MYAAAFQEEHPTAEVEAVATPVNRLEGCIFVGHTNTDTDRQGHAGRVEWSGGDLGDVQDAPEGKVTDPCLSIRYNPHPQRGERRRGCPPLPRDSGAQRGDRQRWVVSVGCVHA